jgi:hypothetical protein
MSRTNLTAKSSTETRILEYLEANASAVLAEKIRAGKKTIAGAMNYAKTEAKKLARGESSICVDDETVFGWIVHFFEENDIAEEKKAQAMRVPGGATVSPKPTAPTPATTAPQSLIDDILM